jgi:hypothetical protein
MSIDEHRELRGRLDAVLEAVTPSPAPVAATLRRGRTIRTRRRIGVAAGLAAAVGIALAAPGLVRQIVRQPPAVPGHKWVLTVYPPGPHPPTGEIAWGTINGKRWQISVDTFIARQAGQCLDAIQTNGQNSGPACAPPADLSQDPSPVIFSGLGINGGVSYMYGLVQPNVDHVVITLSDNATLTLRPYRLGRERWVAFAVPTSLTIASATAYSDRSELGYAIPYGETFLTWLRPGERGLPRATYMIGSGAANGVAWSVTLYIGPWGYCYSFGTCTSSPDRTAEIGIYEGEDSAGEVDIAESAQRPVAYVVATMSDGSTLRVRAVDVAGLRFWAWAVPRGSQLRRVVLYSASGRQLAVQSGAEFSLPPH